MKIATFVMFVVKKEGRQKNPKCPLNWKRYNAQTSLISVYSGVSLNIVTGDERSPLITMIDSILSKQRDTLCSFPRRNIDQLSTLLGGVLFFFFLPESYADYCTSEPLGWKIIS